MFTVVPALKIQIPLPEGAVIEVPGSAKVTCNGGAAVVKSPAPRAPVKTTGPVQAAPVPYSKVAVSAVVAEGAIVSVAPQT
jgi:hypothetical protein